MAHKEYKVKQGDSVSSIAFAHGLFPETIWNDAKNAELKTNRRTPDVLLPGDMVYIPEKKVEYVSGETEKRHRFRRKGVPSKFQLCLKCNGKPRSDEPYILQIEGIHLSGKTDKDGCLKHDIQPGATQGELSLNNGKEIYQIRLGHLDPIDSISGVQSRLNNLGYEVGSVSGELDEHTRELIRAFQKSNGLEENGRSDDPAFKNSLKKAYGS